MGKNSAVSAHLIKVNYEISPFYHGCVDESPVCATKCMLLMYKFKDALKRHESLNTPTSNLSTASCSILALPAIRIELSLLWIDEMIGTP